MYVQLNMLICVPVSTEKELLLLKIPILGSFISKVYLAQFTQAVALLTTTKVPLLNSIQLVKKMIRFVLLQEASR